MKKALIALAAVAALLIVAIVALRRMTHDFSPPEPVAAVPGLFAVKNAFVYEYGANTEGGTVVLFDAGIDVEGRGVDALLATLHARRGDVRDIFLTHGHGDHVGAVSVLSAATVHGGGADREFAEGRRDPGGGGVLYSLYKLLMRPGTATITDGLSERGEVSVGGESVLVIPCPGHTPGSMMFFFRGALIAGDSIQYKDGKLIPAPVGVSEDPAANARCLAELPESLAGLEVETICTGHTGCTPPGATAALLAAVR